MSPCSGCSTPPAIHPRTRHSHGPSNAWLKEREGPRAWQVPGPRLALVEARPCYSLATRPARGPSPPTPPHAQTHGVCATRPARGPPPSTPPQAQTQGESTTRPTRGPPPGPTSDSPSCANATTRTCDMRGPKDHHAHKLHGE